VRAFLRAPRTIVPFGPILPILPFGGKVLPVRGRWCQNRRTMHAAVFDPLKFVDGLKLAGTPAAQAEAIAHQLGEVCAEQFAALAPRAELQASESALRKDLQATEFALRKDMQALEASLRKDMQSLEVSLRKDMQTLEASLRKDMQALATELRHEMKSLANDVQWIKWMLGLQLASVLSLLVKAFA
jgi:hypothetical protein